MKNTVLVTGAAQGLGLVIAQGYYDAGYNVALADVNDSAVQAVGKKMGDSTRVISLSLDVLNKSDFESALDQVVNHFGACHVLVNNAAITPTTPLLEITAEEFSQVLDVNLRGTFLGCQVFGQYFSDRKYGRIINLASLAGQMGGTASGAHYATSKAGIITLSKIFARQFATDGVTVNSIAPGPVDVPSIREKVPADKLEDIINNTIPVKSMSDPKFIASMALMLSDEAANTVTGATWDINGGIFMR